MTYDVLIKRIDSKKHNGYHYEVTVYWNREFDQGYISWTYTLWGARHEAKKLIKKHEEPREIKNLVESYLIESSEESQ